MSILEQAVAHFKEGRTNLEQVEVPEWGVNGSPAVLYYKPTMSLLERGRIMKAFNGDNPATALAEVLIIRCLDADGNRLFRNADKTQIVREVDEEVIARIVNEMQGQTIDISVEDAEKN